MNNTIIICSGGIVNESLSLYFGKITPALLPIKNKTLLEQQLLLCHEFDNIIVNLPNQFQNDSRLVFLKSKFNNIKYFFGKTNSTLRSDLLDIFLKYKLVSSSLLMGDTLFNEDFPINLPNYSASVSKSDFDYSWTHLRNKIVMTGYFYFKNFKNFIKVLDDSLDFKEGLINYNNLILPCEIKLDSWMDLGHYHTYITNKFNYTTERLFNSIKNTDGNFITKSSGKINKITAEYLWFNSLPENLKSNTPTVRNLKNDGLIISYEIEKIFLPTISETYVFGNISLSRFKRIILNCERVLELFKNKEYNKLDSGQFYRNIELKTINRLNLTDINTNLEYYFEGEKYKIADMLKSISFNDNDFVFPMSLSHGDFCFSNMFLDLQTNQIKLIDPRGIDFLGNISQCGNIIYDYAKLYHSIVGQYDFIIAEQYEVNISEKREIKFNIFSSDDSDFIKYVRNKWYYMDKTLLKINIHLFLSMIPLHPESEKRQNAFLANSIRLFKLFKEI